MLPRSWATRKRVNNPDRDQQMFYLGDGDSFVQQLHQYCSAEVNALSVKASLAEARLDCRVTQGHQHQPQPLPDIHNIVSYLHHDPSNQRDAESEHNALVDLGAYPLEHSKSHL